MVAIFNWLFSLDYNIDKIGSVYTEVTRKLRAISTK